MAEEKATAVTLDFTDVKDASDVNSRRVKEGDYRAKIIKVTTTEAKDGHPQWRFVIELQYDGPSAAYGYYCKLVPNQLWKFRNLAVAAGIPVPRKKLKVDPNRLVGKFIGVTMVDDDYMEKKRSAIDSVMPASAIEPDEDDEDENYDDEPEDDEEGEEEEAPAKKSATRRKPAPADDDEDDEDVTDDDLEGLDVDDI